MSTRLYIIYRSFRGIHLGKTSILLGENPCPFEQLERGARKEDRSIVWNRLAAARARLDLAEVALERRRIVAPFEATVLLSRFHPGEFFSVGTSPLFILGNISKLQIRFEVDEIDAFRVEEGQPCAIHGDDDAEVASGTVIRLAPRMGRRCLAVESPTARADVRVREIFVEVASSNSLVPGRRVWGQIDTPGTAATCG